MSDEHEELRSELLRLFADGADAPLDDEPFGELALRVFAHQFEHNEAYRAYCERRGARPDSVTSWRGVPAVPTAAFKEVDLVAGPAGGGERLFRTSGTTRGRERRGRHIVLDPSLYDASLEAGFRTFVLPDGASLPILSLVPSPDELRDSSLSYMAGRLMTSLSGSEGDWFASAGEGLDTERLTRFAREAAERGGPVLLFGTSLAFLHWLEALRETGDALRLPTGSRLMDTGGYKGSRRRVGEGELRRLYGQWLGLPADHCVNEYGMTELLSQCYDTVLRDRHAGDLPGDGLGHGERRKAGPPWLRSCVVDPETLEPVAAGTTGILTHFDLANLDSVSALLTEDMAHAVPGGFVLEGRATDAPPRGCSIAMDLLIESVRTRP